MKRASDTDQDAILDESFLHHGGELGWDVFHSGRLDPREILERAEEGGRADGDEARARAFSIVLDHCLHGWGREVSPEAVGVRALSLAAALGHWAGAGVPAAGMVRVFRSAEEAEAARRILDFLFMDRRRTDALSVGKLVVAVGKFLNHHELEGWSLTQLGKAGAETPAGLMERVRRTCNRPIEYQGGRGKATWQQGNEQRAGSAEAQRRKAAKNRTNHDED